MIYIGIDPGNEGAIAAQMEDGSLEIHDMPIIEVKGAKKKNKKTGKVTQKVRRFMDEDAIYKILRAIRDRGLCKCALEKVGVMPKEGAVGAFTFGTGYGILRGILTSLGIPRDNPTPQEWKKVMMAGMPKGKSAARYRAKQLFPMAASMFELVKHDGRAEAALMSEFMKRACGASQSPQDQGTAGSPEKEPGELQQPFLIAPEASK